MMTKIIIGLTKEQLDAISKAKDMLHNHMFRLLDWSTTKDLEILEQFIRDAQEELRKDLMFRHADWSYTSKIEEVEELIKIMES